VSTPEHEPLAAAVASQIEAVVAAAEQAANEYRRQVETSAQEQADRTRQAAEADARRIRQEAASRAAEYLADSKRIIDEFTADRVSRISTMTDDLIQGAESMQRRFSEAQNVRRQLYELISSLGAVAEAIALEAQVAMPTLPRVSEQDTEESEGESADTPGAQSEA
jgi:DNA anti-recombination protein RmuC